MLNYPDSTSPVSSATAYTYVMASTLNQMVNYIPLVIKDEKMPVLEEEIYNVTLIKVTDGKKVKTEDNSKWDKAFQEVVGTGKVKDILIEQKDWLDTKKNLSRLKETFSKEAKPIFWNITGGQRPFLMAVLEFVKDRPQDVVAYLEGNTGKMGLSEGINTTIDYKVEGLTLKTAFQLMGYDIRGGLLEDKTEDKQEDWVKLWKKYIEKENAELRKAFIQSNKKAAKEEDAINKKEEGFLKIKNCLKDEGLYTLIESKKNKSYPFGYILEEMVVAVLRANFSGEIAEIGHSVKMEFLDETQNKDVDNKQLDEFDVLLLTKTGQFLNFECKSGCMDGDVAKSTKYSTYAIAGVYGKPILITPLTKDEIGKLDDLKEECYNAITSAIRAAKRATLDVWGIDEIEERLNKKLE